MRGACIAATQLAPWFGAASSGADMHVNAAAGQYLLNQLLGLALPCCLRQWKYKKKRARGLLALLVVAACAYSATCVLLSSKASWR